MAFGLLQNKWRILLRSLPYKLRKSTKILHVAARLHNFVINECRMKEDEREGNDEEDETDMIIRTINPPLPRFGYLPTVHIFDPPSPGTSTVRDIILRHIFSHGILRPSFNQERNKNRDNDEVNEESRLELEDVGLM